MKGNLAELSLLLSPVWHSKHNGWIYDESFHPKCLCLKTKLFSSNTYPFLWENYILTGKLSEMLFIFSHRKLRIKSYCSMRCSEKTSGELIMKCTCFLFLFNFSSKFLRIKPTCHVVLQLVLLWLHFEMKLSCGCALVILHILVTTYLQSSLPKFLIKLENQLLQINPQGLG